MLFLIQTRQSKSTSVIRTNNLESLQIDLELFVYIKYVRERGGDRSIF